MYTIPISNYPSASIRLYNTSTGAYSNVSCSEVKFAFELRNLNLVTQKADVYFCCTVTGAGGSGTFNCGVSNIHLFDFYHNIDRAGFFIPVVFVRDGTEYGSHVEPILINTSDTLSISMTVDYAPGIPVANGYTEIFLGTADFSKYPITDTQNYLFKLNPSLTFAWYCATEYANVADINRDRYFLDEVSSAIYCPPIYSEDLFRAADVLPEPDEPDEPDEPSKPVGKIALYTDGSFKPYYCYIRTQNNSWDRYIPYVYTAGDWMLQNYD